MAATDLWQDDGDEGPDGRQALDREWAARREEHFSSGYREGLEAGKHETVQEGFNEGAPCRLHATKRQGERPGQDDPLPPTISVQGMRWGRRQAFRVAWRVVRR